MIDGAPPMIPTAVVARHVKPSRLLIHISCSRASAEGKLSAVCRVSPEFGVNVPVHEVA